MLTRSYFYLTQLQLCCVQWKYTNPFSCREYKVLGWYLLLSLISYKLNTTMWSSVRWSPVQPLSHVQLFATPWTTACQASLSIANFWSLLKLMSIELVMPFSHLILCHPLLILPSIFPSIRVFYNDSVPYIRWSKYWRFSFNINPSNEYSGRCAIKSIYWILGLPGGPGVEALRSQCWGFGFHPVRKLGPTCCN